MRNQRENTKSSGPCSVPLEWVIIAEPLGGWLKGGDGGALMVVDGAGSGSLLSPSHFRLLPGVTGTGCFYL